MEYDNHVNTSKELIMSILPVTEKNTIVSNRIDFLLSGVINYYVTEVR